MIDILKFILTFCYKIFEDYQFKFVDSSIDDSLSRGAWLLLESEDVQLFFSKENGEMLLEMASKYDDRQDKWYFFNLIRNLITKESSDNEIMDYDNGKFIENNIDAILSLFKKENVNKTLKALNKLEKERSKRLWGV